MLRRTICRGFIAAVLGGLGSLQPKEEFIAGHTFETHAPYGLTNHTFLSVLKFRGQAPYNHAANDFRGGKTDNNFVTADGPMQPRTDGRALRLPAGMAGWSCASPDRPFSNAIVIDPLTKQAQNTTAWRARTFPQALALLPDGGRRTLYVRTGFYRLETSVLFNATADGVAVVACPGEMPVVEGPADAPALVFRGTHDVAVSGLSFAGASPVGVMLDGARDSLIAGNTFLDGGTAILLDGAGGNRIEDNLILHPASSGIELRDGSDANLVADNVIDGANAPETHGGGVFLHGVRGNRIAHNLIQDTAGFGIGVSNWDAATVNVANVVEYNVLRDTAMTAQDSGAIYILGRSGADTQVVIAGNVIDGIGAAGRHNVGIYLDDSTNGAMVVRNLVRRAGSDAVQIHGGSDNLVENNILDLGAGRPAGVLFQAAPADTNPLNAQTNNVVTHNIILSSNATPKLFAWFDGGAPVIAGNLYADAVAAVTLPAAPVQDTQPVLGEPGLARDGERDHYAAAQAAAQAAFGFRPVDPAAAGPRPRTPFAP